MHSKFISTSQGILTWPWVQRDCLTSNSRTTSTAPILLHQLLISGEDGTLPSHAGYWITYSSLYRCNGATGRTGERQVLCLSLSLSRESGTVRTGGLSFGDSCMAYIWRVLCSTGPTKRKFTRRSNSRIQKHLRFGRSS